MGLKRQIISKYRSLELVKKILMIIFVISLLQIGMILIISYNLSATIITEQARALVDENLKQNADNIQAAFDRYDSIIQGIYTDSTYVEDLSIINSWDGEQYYLSMHSLNRKMQDLIYLNEEILGIALIGKYGDECFYDSITKSNQESFCFTESMKDSPLVEQALLQKNSIYSSYIYKEDAQYGAHSYFYIAHQLTDFNNYKKGAVGCVVLCIDESRFRRTYSLGMETNSMSFVVDSMGNLLSMPLEAYHGNNIFDENPQEQIQEKNQDKLKGQAYKFVRDIHYFDQKKLDVNAVSLLDGKFYIINIQDYNRSVSRVQYLLVMICMAAALAGVIGFVIVYYISIDIDKSVKKILVAMDKANRGDLDSKIEIEGGDEFSRISTHFNTMLAEIKKSNEQTRESILREKEAEIRSLEAQINPHFLYNTLDTINWQAIEEKQFTISQMVTKLAHILRYSINNSNEIVMIETEIEYLKKYIYLQQQRFEYSFDCTIDAEEDVWEYRIHKLLLQPLAENAIVHGLSGITYRGDLKILIQQENEGKILIEISDNGHGMSQKQVDEFNSYDYRRDKVGNSIGIRNVITRIKLYYGEQGSIQFLSGEKGTIIRIIIPAE